MNRAPHGLAVGLGLAVLMLAWGNVAEAVHLRGQIMRVGYTGSPSENVGTTGDIYRMGRYAPVLVELTNDDGDQFDGIIEVRQKDGDGDELVASREVSLRGRRQFNLYIPGGPSFDAYWMRGQTDGPAPFSVRVFDLNNRLAPLHDDKSEPVKELAPPRAVIAASGDIPLILDASHRPLNQVDRLKRRDRTRDFALMRCAPKELPDHVSGLEMIDIMIWDGADPNLLDGLQNDAIIEWVRRGGRLVIGVSRNWNLLTASRLGPHLPARINGTKTDTVSASKSRTNVFRDLIPEKIPDHEKQPDSDQLTYCPVTPSDLVGDAASVVPVSPGRQDQIWVARRSCGRGQIVLVFAELQELLPAVHGNEAFLRDHLLRLRVIPERKDYMNTWETPRDIFMPVASRTAFHAASGFYFTFAFAFVVGYIAMVSGVSWNWLKRRNATRQAWVVFAGLAAAASAVSLGAVQVVRAFGQGVHEVTIVDGRADSFEATALSYLGLKTASHMQLDLCVPNKWHQPADSPEARGSLRPYVGSTEDKSHVTFSSPLRYQAVGQLGELRDVPIRATLKRFQAAWRGEMNGRIRASLRHSNLDNRLDAGSWIENQLGTDLHSCYLFSRASRNQAVQVYYLPYLAAGDKVDLDTICKQMEVREKERRAQPSIAAIRERLRLTRNDETWQWSPPLLRELMASCLTELAVPNTQTSDDLATQQMVLAKTVPAYVPSLLLLTFYHDPMVRNLIRHDVIPVRSQGEELEMSAEVQPGMALFVGFSENPGPLRLCKRKPGGGPAAWKAIQPSQSVVMYRELVPVR